MVYICSKLISVVSLLVNLQHKNREELPVKCKKSNVIEEPKEEQIEFSVPPPTMS